MHNAEGTSFLHVNISVQFRGHDHVLLSVLTILAFGVCLEFNDGPRLITSADDIGQFLFQRLGEHAFYDSSCALLPILCSLDKSSRPPSWERILTEARVMASHWMRTHHIPNDIRRYTIKEGRLVFRS